MCDSTPLTLEVEPLRLQLNAKIKTKRFFLIFKEQTLLAARGHAACHRDCWRWTRARLSSWCLRAAICGGSCWERSEGTREERRTKARSSELKSWWVLSDCFKVVHAFCTCQGTILLSLWSFFRCISASLWLPNSINHLNTFSLLQSHYFIGSQEFGSWHPADKWILILFFLQLKTGVVICYFYSLQFALQLPNI